MKDNNLYENINTRLGAYREISVNFSDNDIGQIHAPLKILLMLDMSKIDEINNKRYKISFRYYGNSRSTVRDVKGTELVCKLLDETILRKNEFKIINLIMIKPFQQKKW